MKPKALTEGALLCGLSVILALLCYYVPFMIIFYIFIPVPIVVLCRRHGFGVSMISSAAATLILFLLVDVLSAATFGMYLILVGCGLGYAYFKEKSGFTKMMAAYLSVLITLLGMLVIAQLVTGQNFIEMLSTELTAVGNQVMDTYRSIGLLSGDQLSQMQTILDQMLTSIKMTIPLAFLMMPFFIAWANVVVCDTLLKRLKVPVTAMPSLSQWRVPRSLKTFLLIIVMFLLVVQIGGLTMIPEIYTYTLMQIVYYVYILMGVGFLFWLVNRKRKKESMGLKVLIVAICLLVPFTSYIISMLGVADIYMNVRQLIEMKDGMKK
ncbi:YybS family protein [Eubacterium sp.]|uniref:YybS family protein n=1 Tax=Eubacterium sp. TaxID=142586 RepID=UPI002FCC34FA